MLFIEGIQFVNGIFTHVFYDNKQSQSGNKNNKNNGKECYYHALSRTYSIPRVRNKVCYFLASYSLRFFLFIYSFIYFYFSFFGLDGPDVRP